MKDRLKQAILENIRNWKKGDLAGVANDGIHCYVRGSKVFAEYLDGGGRVWTTFAKVHELRQTNFEY